jgi:hypothetical protein
MIYRLDNRLGVVVATYVVDGNRAPPSRIAYIRVSELYERERLSPLASDGDGVPHMVGFGAGGLFRAKYIRSLGLWLRGFVYLSIYESQNINNS